jgi:hypothetical protein
MFYNCQEVDKTRLTLGFVLVSQSYNSVHSNHKEVCAKMSRAGWPPRPRSKLRRLAPAIGPPIYKGVSKEKGQETETAINRHLENWLEIIRGGDIYGLCGEGPKLVQVGHGGGRLQKRRPQGRVHGRRLG